MFRVKVNKKEESRRANRETGFTAAFARHSDEDESTHSPDLVSIL